VYNSLILTAHCASSQAPRRRRLSRVFHGRLLHFMSISAHFRVMGVLWACVPVRVQRSGRRAVAVLTLKGEQGTGQ
jgi:hypothetical protein